MSKVKFRTNDGVVYEVLKEVAIVSSVMKEMFDNMIGIDNGNDDPILLTKVDSKTLRKVLEYCTFHKDDVPITKDRKTKKTADISEWDQKFLDEVLFLISK